VGLPLIKGVLIGVVLFVPYEKNIHNSQPSESFKNYVVKPAHINSVQTHRQQVRVHCKDKPDTLFGGKNPSIL
jgi:hypothetical protein